MADGAGKTVRGSASVCGLCRSADAGATRAADVLRDVASSLRATGLRECAPDDRLREAIHFAAKEEWIASSQVLLAMTLTEPPHTLLSYPAHAGYPVRRGFSVLSLMSLEYWADSTGQAGR